MGSTAEVDTVVSIHYALTLDSGEQVDSSDGSEPLQYLHGHGNIVPGLEQEITGRSVGEKLAVRVTPEDGYGVPDPDGVQKLPRSNFPDDLELAPGMPLQAEDGDGGVVMMQVVHVTDDEVTVDMNHPLAGQVLNFAVELVEVRAATQEELRHGHVHGPDGHQH